MQHKDVKNAFYTISSDISRFRPIFGDTTTASPMSITATATVSTLHYGQGGPVELPSFVGLHMQPYLKKMKIVQGAKIETVTFRGAVSLTNHRTITYSFTSFMLLCIILNKDTYIVLYVT